MRAFKRFYEMQSPEARIAIIILTTFAAVCFLALAVNLYYYYGI
jgi:hypothetical protein